MAHRSMSKKIQGTAIFMALLMIAIVAATTVLIMRTQQIDIRRTQMMLTAEQAYLYGQGIIDWAKATLIADLQNPQANNTVWPIVMPPTDLPDGQGKIAGILQDAQGLININNFANINQSTPASQSPQTTTPTAGPNTTPPQTQPAANLANIANTINKPTMTSGSSSTTTSNYSQQTQMALSNLLGILGVQITPAQVKNLINAISGWENRSNPSPLISMDAYDEQYSRANPPYRSPHAPMVGTSELRIVQGVTPNIYNALAPYLVALPINTSINTIHSPPQILQALGLNAQSQQQTSSASGPPGQNASQFFLLRADVFIQDQHVVLYALLQRQANPKAQQLPTISILWQSFGTEA